MLRSTLACLAVIALPAVLVAGTQQGQTQTPPPPPQKTDKTVPPVDYGPMESTDSTGKKFTFKAPNVQKGDIAVLETSLGTIKIELYPDKAPKHVANFEKLAEAGFYDGTKFHRVIPGFMIQGGDPNSRGSDRSIMGTGGPGYSVGAEFNDTDFDRGVLGMARSQDPNSAGSQFFIMVHRYPSLNNQYTAFGKVKEGLDIADKIVALDRDGNDNPLDANPAIVKSVKIVHPAVDAGK